MVAYLQPYTTNFKKMLNIFNQYEINELVKKKKNEIKLGEKVSVINEDNDFFEEVKNSAATFIVIGVPEDIGTKVNGEQGGTHKAFFPAIEAFLNTQENQFIKGKSILMLGYLDYLDTVDSFVADDAEKGDYLVKQIDKDLAELIHFLISIDKVPIIIGGGHNNAYGAIKGLSTAKNQSINAINFDMLTGLYSTDIRHNENAFSYAINDGYLDKYFMFGLHENYTPQYIFEYIHNSINIEYTMFEEIAIYQTSSFKREMQRAKLFVADQPFGLEVDVKAIQNFPSHNTTPTGFSPQHVRRFVRYFAKNNNACYLHIAEASIPENTSNTSNIVGSFISYLITDFIKAKNN